jgi:hypothetical protein
VDHTNHCEKVSKDPRRAKRHVFQSCPDDVFRENNRVVGKNTLRTSKLGSDLHADFDRKEITF